MSSPSPTPGPAVEYLNEYAVRELFAVVVGLGLILLIAIVLTKAIVQAGKLPPPATLVTALSVLTLLSIAGGITTNNDEAWAIAAAGIGALAGSVSTVYQNATDDRLWGEKKKKETTDGESSTGQDGDDALPEDR